MYWTIFMAIQHWSIVALFAYIVYNLRHDIIGYKTVDNSPTTPVPPTISPHLIPVLTPPIVVTPPQQWYASAQKVRQNNLGQYKFPVLDWYFPACVDIGNHIAYEKSRGSSTPYRNGVIEGLTLNGIYNKQELANALRPNLLHLMNDIQSGQVTPTS